MEGSSERLRLFRHPKGAAAGQRVTSSWPVCNHGEQILSNCDQKDTAFAPLGDTFGEQCPYTLDHNFRNAKSPWRDTPSGGEGPRPRGFSAPTPARGRWGVRLRPQSMAIADPGLRAHKAAKTAGSSKRITMDKTFDPAAIERRIRQDWEDAGRFRAGRPERASAAPYSSSFRRRTSPAICTWAMRSTTRCRTFWRVTRACRVRDVLWQPGTDHAGIATQMVVERQLMERQEPSRRDIGREKFLERVWAWKASRAARSSSS